MPFLKQTLMWIFFIVAMYLGGASTQSSSNVLQGMGFVSVVLAFICLYIIFKLMWNARGTLTTIAVTACVVVYCAYTLGLFNGKTVKGIMTGESPASFNNPTDEHYKNPRQPKTSENSDIELFGGDIDEEETNSASRQTANNRPENNGGLIGQMKTYLFGDQSNSVHNMDINPFDYPATSGYARVVTGSTLNINGLNIKMYGIDAPDITQTCADRHGRGYYCGREARTWLQDWLNNREVTCYILGQIENGWATGVCFVDNNNYDVAAVTVNAGWAVAYTKNTDIYVPYEHQAGTNKRGLWAGTFYKPWDWKKLQSRKSNIRIEKAGETSVGDKAESSLNSVLGAF